MVRIWWIFEDLPSSMISASWVEASLGFSEWRETCKSLYLRRIIQILARTKVLEENKRPKNVRSQGNQTATELKYVLLPIISNKEGREACVRALEYSKQTAKSTYQCHFVLYFVSASVDHPLTLWALWNTGLMVLSVKISCAAVSIWSGWESTEIFSVNLASNGDSI